MRIESIWVLNFIMVLLMACAPLNAEKDPILKALNSNNPKIKRVMDNLDKHDVQILFTEIKRNTDGSVTFIDHEFQVNPNTYFYPASTVKLPIAILALEKLNIQNQYNRNTFYTIEGDTIKHTISNDIEKIFAVSDNDAYNRLHEYLGKDDINNRLNDKGIDSRISHRVSVINSDALTTKPLVFFLNNNTSIKQDSIKNKPIESLDLNSLLKGKGYIEKGELINQPMNFAYKNYLPLKSLHGIMKRVFFSEEFSDVERFNLSESDRNALITSMKLLPKDAHYNSKEYHDSYVKFFIYGDTKTPIGNEIEIYNKVGYAFGTLTDCAYIKNKKTQKEFIITATLMVNENEIFNDDNYEYESIGIPFLAELGRQLVLK